MRQAHYDLVILGSGSTAFAAALRAQELGKTSVMTEERITGGTCVNRGCLPSKNLIEAAKIIHDARHPRYPGLAPAEVRLNFRELIAQKDDVVHGYREKKYESLVGGQFSIEEGHAEFLDDHTITVGGKRLTGEKILIASGSRPVAPTIEGLDEVPYLTSDLLTNNEPMELWELGDTPGFARAIAAVIAELRLARLACDEISKVAPDLVPLTEAYEAAIAEAGLTDWPGVLALATEAASGRVHPLVS